MNKKHFNKSHCTNKVRQSTIDFMGRQVVLTGIHAFEWSITIIDLTNRSITTTIYRNRVEATKIYKTYIVKKKRNGKRR